MIRGYEPYIPLEPEDKPGIQWGPAVGAGFIAGLVLLLVPRGSPWSALTFFSPAILGRSMSSMEVPLAITWVLHLVVSIIYGLIISRVVAGLRQQRAVLIGGVAGLVLYFANLAMVSFCWPVLRGNEAPVVFAHVVFGLIAAGAYCGLLRRRTPAGSMEPGG
jgi:hypothetical protein